MKERFIPREAITIADGKIVYVSSVAKGNLENQRRIEKDRLGIRRVHGIVDGKRI